MGTVAKVNLALSRLPSFKAIEDGAADLAGRIHIGPDTDYLERAFDAAKYGDFSPRPYLDITIPSLADSSLAPSGGHVMSIHVQYAPYSLKRGDWTSRREDLADAVLQTLSDYAPDIRDVIVHRQVLTPLDLEETYGLTGGHIFHGEHALDQLFAFRPLLGWAQYRTPISRLPDEYMGGLFRSSLKFEHQPYIDAVANEFQSVGECPVCCRKGDSAVEWRYLHCLFPLLCCCPMPTMRNSLSPN